MVYSEPLNRLGNPKWKSQNKSQIQEGENYMRRTVLVMLTLALAPFCAFAVDGVVLVNQSTLTAISNTVCATALSPVKPRRRSVTPAAIQMWVPLGSEIIGPRAPG